MNNRRTKELLAKFKSTKNFYNHPQTWTTVKVLVHPTDSPSQDSNLTNKSDARNFTKDNREMSCPRIMTERGTPQY